MYSLALIDNKIAIRTLLLFLHIRQMLYNV